MTLVVTVVVLAAAGAAGVRWLRVSQREHYLPGRATRFAVRWWAGLGPNRLLAAAAVVAAVITPLWSPAALVVAAAVAVGPLGLGLRGTAPGPLAWTRRLGTLAAVGAVAAGGVLAAGGLLGALLPTAVVVTLLAPAVVDLAALVCKPVEDARVEPFVEQAKARLAAVRPEVVALTGSYGKTSTKGFVAHLAGGARTVYPSPASFNNRAGLARAINEGLAPGTEVFVAEMGTYGRGEIAELCAWLQPRVAALLAIGPVHLERFGTEEAIVEAKAEIFATAEICVLNIDDSRLAALADRLEARGDKDVVRCSATHVTAEVTVVPEAGGITLWLKGEEVAHVDGVDAPPTNVACAVAVALRLGTPLPVVVERLATLPAAAHRLDLTTGTTGAAIIDDTYNANPAGGRAALAALARHARPGHRRVVVTPGMVELGPRADTENEAFAAAAVAAATTVVVVGRTNRRALLAGAARGPRGCEVVVVDERDQAVAWVREHCGPGDVVLYENDLPDHFA